MKIWFNRWFSTVTHYIEMIRNNPDNRKFTIYGTHPKKDTVYLKYCDVSGTEPDIDGEEYLDFCLGYCKKNEIEVFIPRKENVLIAKNLHKFSELGVRVLVCPDSNLMNLMDNKLAMYKDLEEKQKEGKHIVALPSYRVVNNVADFEKAYNEITSMGYQACIKPVVGEGACGFRIIDNYVENINYLLKTSGSQRISFNQLKTVLGSVETFPDLMVLEYLGGTEYSIDCIADNKGNLCTVIPRKKGDGRIRELEYNEELIKIAKDMTKEYRIPYCFNIQLRYSNGVPKLLEINPRMSGGLHISCLSGINFPYVTLKLLLGENVENLKPNYGLKATHVEQPILLTE